MATKQSSKFQATPKQLVKPSDWLNFSSAVVIAVIASILYYTGWVYTTHWYGYYGIDASQINLQPQLVIIHGIPGLFFLALTSLISILGYTFYAGFVYKRFIDKTDVLHISFIGYLVGLLLMLAISFALIGDQRIEIPPELIISSVFIVALLWVNVTNEYIFIFLSFISGKPIYITSYRIPFVMPRFMAWSISLFIMIRKSQQSRDMEKLKRIFSLPPRPEILREIRKTQKEFTKAADDQKEKLNETILRAKGFFTSTILLFYFLISVSLSAVLGEWDASRGGRLMVGNWRVPEITLFSSVNIPALAKYENTTISGQGYEYKNLGLLASDDKGYYLVDLKTTSYFKTKPNVYIIPRSDSLNLSFIVSPFIPPRPTPLATITNTTTLMPTATVTQTP